MPSFFDTHCHYNSPRFTADLPLLIEEGRAAGLTDALVCAGGTDHFSETAAVARRFGFHYALGIHPLFLPEMQDEETEIEVVKTAVEAALSDPLFAAVGEIGLDGYVENLPMLPIDTQQRVFNAQLKIAKKHNLPVSVHARHAVDLVTSSLRRLGPGRGVVHAFNGSSEQARILVSLGYKLGFGGALTYSGSKRIRRIFSELSEKDFVLETDAPDMPGTYRSQQIDTRTHPADIALVCSEAALIRGTTVEDIARQAFSNAEEAFAR